MIVAITQARIGSTRLPAKVLKQVNGKPMLQIHLERLRRTSHLDRIIVATTMEPGVDEILSIAKKMETETFQGATHDVLDRYYQCAKKYEAEYIVRITSDCPLIDPAENDKVIDAFLAGGYDYVTNSLRPTFPDGMDIEIFTFAALEKAWLHATDKQDREHVTSYIWRNSTCMGANLFSSLNYEQAVDYSGYRLTLDTPDDLENIGKLIQVLGDDKTWMQYITYVQENIESFKNIKS